MALLDDVTAAISDAMKARDRDRLSALRLLKTALTNREVERGQRLDEAEALKVVAGLARQRRDSIGQFEKAGRTDLARAEAAQLAVLERYLPAAPTALEIDEAIAAVIAETGASSPKDLGRVMKGVMARLQDRGVDGKAVSDAVRRHLGD